jgi:uncharacterized glyoxalase superfamily protein PhnB
VSEPAEASPIEAKRRLAWTTQSRIEGQVESSDMAIRNRSVPADTVLPHVVYQDLVKAMAWLERAFGFREYYRYGAPSGGQMWAGKAAIQVRQAGEGQKPPRELGYGTQSLTIFVDDVDGHYARARAAGAKILEEPHETEYGEYQYAAEDPDGHHWLFSRHTRDADPEEWGATVAGTAG